MRQVPKYAIIGNGRMALHMQHYLNFLSLDYATWSRAHDSIESLHSLLSISTHALILISDAAIDPFIETHIISRYPSLTLSHFSGSLQSKYAYSAHPLQTFAHSLLPLDDYKKIPFIISEGPEFIDVLPGFVNPHYKIKCADKAYYHALCVMANNFTILLWQKFFTEMHHCFGVPQQDLQPFLKQTFHNLKQDYENALTGPIARGDTETLQRDLKALENDRFYGIFKAFIENI